VKIQAILIMWKHPVNIKTLVYLQSQVLLML